MFKGQLLPRQSGVADHRPAPRGSCGRAKGVPLPTVQQLLGHATIAMTMRYAHLAPNAFVQAIEVLDWDDGPEKCGHPVGNAVVPVPPVPQPAIGA